MMLERGSTRGSREGVQLDLSRDVYQRPAEERLGVDAVAAQVAKVSFQVAGEPGRAGGRLQGG
jgi:hypothetical protein